MGFLDETAILLGIDNSRPATFTCIRGNNAVVVEGYKKIIELSNTCIKLLCEDNMLLELSGKDIVIKEISHREIAICGDLSGVSFVRA